jgi:hypothetical protein
MVGSGNASITEGAMSEHRLILIHRGGEERTVDVVGAEVPSTFYLAKKLETEKGTLKIAWPLAASYYHLELPINVLTRPLSKKKDALALWSAKDIAEAWRIWRLMAEPKRQRPGIVSSAPPPMCLATGKLRPYCPCLGCARWRAERKVG